MSEGWVRMFSRTSPGKSRLVCVRAAVLAWVVVALPAAEASAGPDSTYSVGVVIDGGWDVTVSHDGNAIVTGSAGDEFQTTPGAVNLPGPGPSPDAFVLKVDPTGRAVYSAVLGGEWSDEGTAVAVADDGSVYLAGKTHAQHFPTTPGVIARTDPTIRDGEAAFLAKLSPDGSELEWSTLLPGVRNIYDLSVDQMGRTHLVGDAYKELPVSADAFVKDRPAGDLPEGFVGTVDPRGSRWVGASYFGGAQIDFVTEIELAPGGGAFVSGRTRSSDFPSTTGSFDPDFSGDEDAFVAKVTDDGTGLVWSTFLGGRLGPSSREFEDESVERLDVDPSGTVVVEGYTNNDDFPTTPGAAFPTRPEYYETDSFVARITPDGSRLELATYLPPARGVGVDAESHMHLVSLLGPDDPPGTPFGSASVVDLEMDASGAIVDVHDMPGPRPLDFEVDAAGTVYFVGTSWPTTAGGQRSFARARTSGLLTRQADCTISGSNRSDVLRGTSGPDVICARAGDDVIRGRGGHDIVLGGLGHDRVVGGDGVDVLEGGSGPDLVFGSRQRDLLLGGPGADVLTGDEGSDSLLGGVGRDHLRGGPGRDGLRGGPDTDRCAGGDGRDRSWTCES